jgi:hypothetical protein
MALLLCFPSLAQQSASFKIEEHAFNAGGHPHGGVVMVSAHRVRRAGWG